MLTISRGGQPCTGSERQTFMFSVSKPLQDNFCNKHSNKPAKYYLRHDIVIFLCLSNLKMKFPLLQYLVHTHLNFFLARFSVAKSRLNAIATVIVSLLVTVSHNHNNYILVLILFGFHAISAKTLGTLYQWKS